MAQPNIVFVFADQLRLQALGYAGNRVCRTPNLDRLARQGVNFSLAVSGCPVCSPARASLLTGQYPDRHGVFVNDVCLPTDIPTLAEVLAAEGYQTGYIGKWHVDGHGRSRPVPPDRRHGFDYWKALECTHDYNHSAYFAGNETAPRHWDGYDTIAQTRDAQAYLRSRGDRPFLLALSYGTPHAPYHTAPKRYRDLYDPADVPLRPNVPEDCADDARRQIAGYYAHVAAIDEMVGDLLATLEETGRSEDTIFVFWSDHGDMLGSQGVQKKQRPYDESIRVPLLVRYPRRFGLSGAERPAPINTPDLPVTLLGLAGVEPPATMQGRDYSAYAAGEAPAPAEEVLLACYHPFGQYSRSQHGGKEYRGLRTGRHTYCRDLDGPWLLFDNQADPWQERNLIDDAAHAELRDRLDARLSSLLDELGDAFLPGQAYLDRWGYATDESGTVPYEL